jgi:hypothetical protein
MFQKKHCEDFIKASYSLSGNIEKKNLTVRKQPEKQFRRAQNNAETSVFTYHFRQTNR